MMVQMNCRGYASAQFMQPEPAKYARGPALEAQTFMQPEQAYYAHHPGRFFYLKDERSGELVSLPYEPVRAEPERFVFSAGQSDVTWTIEQLGLRCRLRLSLPCEDVVELWSLEVSNLRDGERDISVYSYFPVGMMSWMNQSASYREALQGILCESVTPYQKVEDYFKHQNFQDMTFFLADREPSSWETRQAKFEGEGGLHAPSALREKTLDNGRALYETPAAILHFPLRLEVGQSESFKFLFGPAKDQAQVLSLKKKYLDDEQGFSRAGESYAQYLRGGEGGLKIESPDEDFNAFVNHWLPRQVYYHGDVNRLTSDPQTRNYLQDAMGMVYIKPSLAKAAFSRALSQQASNGSMPDGVLLHKEAELKYINQVPHVDHAVWLPLCIRAYLDETGDYEFLSESLPFAAERGEPETATVLEHLERALRYLMGARDGRGLHFIEQGDWCDPMNMVGYRGKGVSTWLSLASAYAMKQWAQVCEQIGEVDLALQHHMNANTLNNAVNQHCWDGSWYSRGISDEDTPFGVSSDVEGKIYLNPQSWSLLSGAADLKQEQSIKQAVEEILETPFGVMMLGPSYTHMHEHIGRLTQKFPGSAENGSVYNHAAIFYAYSLFERGDADSAFALMRKMLPSRERADLLRRGQLPNFIPNYYRGAFHQFPEAAGQSSQLFNTGTVAWFYRTLIDGLLGLRGCGAGIGIRPALPSYWPSLRVERLFRGARLEIECVREMGRERQECVVNGQVCPDGVIEAVQVGQDYSVKVMLPEKGSTEK